MPSYIESSFMIQLRTNLDVRLPCPCARDRCLLAECDTLFSRLTDGRLPADRDAVQGLCLSATLLIRTNGNSMVAAGKSGILSRQGGQFLSIRTSSAFASGTTDGNRVGTLRPTAKAHGSPAHASRSALSTQRCSPLASLGIKAHGHSPSAVTDCLRKATV